MSERKLSMEDIQMLNVLEKATGARATDVITSDQSVLFVIEKGQIGRAIGRGGANIKKMESLFNGKKVDMVEGADNIQELMYHAFAPAIVKSVDENTNLEGKAEAYVTVDAKDKGLAIGRNGERIKRARLLAKRFFNVEEVKIQ